MKRINKFFLIGAVAAMSFAACENLEDYTTVVDATDVLLFADNVGIDNAARTTVSHTPVGSTGGFEKIFYVKCNSGLHDGATVNVAYSEKAAQDYIDLKNSSAQVLPAEYIRVEKYVKGAETSEEPVSSAVLTLPQGERATADSVKVVFTGDYSLLTEREYVAAFTITSDQIKSSQVSGTYYLRVLCEQNITKPVKAASDIVGFTPDDYSSMIYLQGGNGSINQQVTLTTSPIDFEIDLKTVYNITGLTFTVANANYGFPTVSAIEYSVDGKEYKQAGTPGSNALRDGTNLRVGFYEQLKARYIKFTADGSTITSASYRRFNSISFAYLESNNPMVYLASTSYTGSIVHTPIGSLGTLNVSLAPRNILVKEDGDISVSANVNNELIGAYNKAHGTNYVAIDPAAITVSDPVTIAANETNASASITVTFAEGTDLSEFDNDNGFLIPVALATTDAEVSATKSVAYIVVSSAHKLFKKPSSATDILGTATTAASKAGYSIIAPTGVTTPANLFDGKTNTYAVFPSASSHEVIIDFGKEINLSGWRIGTGSSYNSVGYDFAYSTDGTTFTSFGACSSADQYKSSNDYYFGLYGAVRARYFKLKTNFPYYSYGNSYRRYAEFYTYEVIEEPTD